MEKIINFKEKRTDRRYKFAYCFEITGDDFKTQPQIENISCGGIFCQADRFIPLKTKLNIKMDISLFINRRRVDNTINCAAEVVWIDSLIEKKDGKYNLGINFSDVSENDKSLILKFLKQKNLSEAKELREMFRALKKMVAELTSLEEAHLKAENFRRVLNHAISELESVAFILDSEIDELKHLN